MFKPPLHDFRTPFGHQTADLGNLARAESEIEGERQVIEPDFAFVASLEDMHMHPLGQVVAVKTDPLAVLDEHRWHGVNL